MWNWPMLRWLALLGWWPYHFKNPRVAQISRICGYTLFVINFIQLWSEYMALYMRIRDGSLRATIFSMNTTIVGTACMVKVFNGLYHGDRLFKLLNKINELEARGHLKLGEAVESIAKPYKRRALLLWRITQFCIISTGHWAFTPVYTTLTGSTKTYIMDSWTPWSQESWTGWTVLITFQIPHVFSAVAGMFILNCLFCYMLLCILHNFDVLASMFSSLDLSRKDADLKFYVQFHIDLLWATKELNELFKIVVQFQSVVTVVVCCFSVVEITGNSNNPLNKQVNLFELVSSTAFYFFVDCYLCQCVTEATSDVLRSAYENNWYFASVENKRVLNLLLERTKKSQMFGDIVLIDLNTYITVIKSVFSYYNFLQALEVTS